MSITFSPQVNYSEKVQPEALSWSASWFDRAPMPDSVKKVFIDRGVNYIDEYYYELGNEPYPFWLQEAATLGLRLVEDYPYSKLFMTPVGDSGYGFRLYGEKPEHVGMEMQLANENARALCQYLRIDEGGSMHPLALLRLIEGSRDRGNAEAFTRSETDEQRKDPTVPFGLNDGPRVISFGLSEDKMAWYLLKLENLCDHCIRYECNVSWG
jgi:hypothetical protein